MLTVSAPAKINLVLEVLGKYDANYHRILSILQTIDLCDVLHLEIADGVSFHCSEPDLEPDNLVVKAAVLLRQLAGCRQGVRIGLDKHIPWGVGLGGGSSDAAAALVALNKLWGLNLSAAELVEVGSQLGSDIPFFIYGGTALVAGRGEVVTPLPSFPTGIFILLVPPLTKIPGKTRQLYDRLTAECYSSGQIVREALAYCLQGRSIPHHLMHNAFETVAFNVFPELRKYVAFMEQIGAEGVHLVGSGPALFTVTKSNKEAGKLLLDIKARGLESYLASIFSGDMEQ